ncbi:EGF-like domain containing protein, partial [Oryctes borbonicus]
MKYSDCKVVRERAKIAFLIVIILRVRRVNSNVTLVSEGDDFILPQDGYFLDDLNEISSANVGSDVLQCPTDNVITTRYKCKVDGKWVDCNRKHCCKDYVYLSGRCIHKDQDPCSMGFCEQVCTVYLQRIICTCHEGYKFKPENQRLGIKPVCVDVDECLDNNGDCQHNCINEPGSYRCSCREGFLLRGDNRTCYPQSVDMGPANPVLQHGESQNRPGVGHDEALEANRDRCYANCDTVSRLHDRLKILQEKVCIR